MRVLFASLFYSDDVAASAPLLRALPAAVAARGHEVNVLHLARRDAFASMDCVGHHYVSAPLALKPAAFLASAATGRPRPLFEWPRRCADLLRSVDPEIVHVHGTQLHFSLARLRRILPPDVKLVVHYHGGSPANRPGLRGLQRRNLQRAQAVLFTTPDQARAFEGMLAGKDRAALLVETSSDFGWMDRHAARARTKMHGRPVYLSAARLHPDKDPLTVLRGFEHIAAAQPNARLYHYFLSDEMLRDLRAFVAARPLLRDAVHFRGRADRDEMESVFNSADVLLQASRREFSGCAVLDAMACGVVPVVTDLPSLRMIAGRHGRFFAVGDAEGLAHRALDVDPASMHMLATEVRRHFDCELSFGAMARKLESIYSGL